MDSALYDELHRVEQTHWWFRARRRIVWSLVNRFAGGVAGRRLKICELGCGTGGNLVGIADKHDVTGVECSPHALAYAQQRLGNRVIHGSLPHDINLPPASFNVVMLTDVLEHIEDDAASAQTALSLLSPGGIVVATVPAYQWLYSPRDAHHHHFRRYGKQQFAALWPVTQAETLLLSHYNTLLFPPAAAVRLASRIAGSRNASEDLRIPARPLNRLLTHIMQCEANVLGRLPVPFGLSLVAVARKKRTVESSMRAAA
jgi:2-polyprenyl-3-methyl-5-hydroxy-6-metoxy-1,4-benzoquinol methylase